MMMTPERLSDICNLLGYSLEARKITDWIQKGLLPPLKSKGRGRGKGRIYYWSYPNIVSQALAVSEFMNWHSQADHVLLMTGFAGFQIVLERFRSLWLDMMRIQAEGINKRYSDSFKLEEKIERTMRRAILALSHKSEERASEQLIEIATKIFFSKEFDPMDHVTERELGELGKALLGEQIVNRRSSFILKLLQFLHAYFSPMARIKLLESVTNDELLEAQNDWGTILRILEPTIRVLYPSDDNAWPDMQMARLWWRILAQIGGYSILFIIALRKTGYEEQMDQSISILIDSYNHFPWAKELKSTRRTDVPSDAILSAFHAVISQMSAVWKFGD